MDNESRQEQADDFVEQVDIDGRVLRIGATMVVLEFEGRPDRSTVSELKELAADHSCSEFRQDKSDEIRVLF